MDENTVRKHLKAIQNRILVQNSEQLRTTQASLVKVMLRLNPDFVLEATCRQQKPKPELISTAKAADCGMFSMPPELLLLVIGQLDLVSVLKLRMGSSRLVQILDGISAIWFCLELTPRIENSQFLAIYSRSNGMVQTLTLPKKLTNSCFQMSKLLLPRRIAKLCVLNNKITGPALITFLAAPSNLKTLTHLQLNMNKLDSLSLSKMLHFFENLTFLDVSGCSGIDDAAFTKPLPNQRLLRLPKLQHIAAQNTMLSDRTVYAIATFCESSLLSINLCGCAQVSKKSLVLLTPCRRLESIEIKDMDFNIRLYVDADTAFLLFFQACISLKSFALPACPYLTDNAVSYMANFCPMIETLVFDHNANIANGALENLLNCENLHSLTLSCCPRLTADALNAFLHQKQNFTYLDLSGNSSVTDDTLLELVSMTELVWLGLSECKNVSGYGLLSILRKDGKPLQKLRICSNPQISTQTVRQFQTALRLKAVEAFIR